MNEKIDTGEEKSKLKSFAQLLVKFSYAANSSNNTKGMKELTKLFMPLISLY